MPFTAGAKARASTHNNDVRGSAIASCSADLTVTTGILDVTGASVTITTPVANVIAVVHGVFDVTATNAGDLFAGYLAVDGTAQAEVARWVGANVRGTVAQVWRVTLASAGAHTLKLQAQKSGTAGVVTVTQTHTRILVEANGI